MKVGFIGFGEVASTLSQGLLDGGADVSTCLEGRSSSTKELAKKNGVKICLRSVDMAEESDILICSVVPSMAINVAHELGKYSKGVYVDINNISPATAREALAMVENQRVVDASIIGSVKKNGSKVQIIASGNSAADFAILNDFGLNIRVIGSEIGQSSGIKMLRSSYTKGVSALLWETVLAAYEMGIDEEVLDIIGETEGDHFKDSANSRLVSSAVHSNRRYEEMKEVQKVLSEVVDPIMSQCTEKTFELIFSHLGRIEKRPENYRDVFKLWKKDL
jgi:3-hydroxyisobutyrate dehydrogenase-like beta-hydroxyacid dehydrogenase